MKGSRLKSSSSISTSQIHPTSSLNKSKNYSAINPHAQVQNSNSFPKIEEEYISNLQKQIYYLELEMKLMKDKEIETKNKVGGYEILFRDGVPLNEHFLALKTKYTDEKDSFEKLISDLENEILNIINENKSLQSEVDQTNRNYFDIIEKTSHNGDFYKSKIYELTEKLVNESNSKESLEKDKEILTKSIYKMTSENVHHTRTIEKNKLFKENVEEKNKALKLRHLSKFEEVDKLLIRSLLEQEAIERKLADNLKGKQIENENTFLIGNINKLERDLHMAKAKVSEYENLQILNKKYLLDEELTKGIYEKEHKRLNEELDGLVKLNEDTLRQKVKENEKNQSILIKNSISSSEVKMNLILTKFKEEEATARGLLEEKNNLMQKIQVVKEIIENQVEKEFDVKREIITFKNGIDEVTVSLDDNKTTLNGLIDENEFYKKNADKIEVEIKTLKKKIEEAQQKIELNTILKDIDVGELKVLSQNNAIVNSSINSLISKWDKVQNKLKEIEEKNDKYTNDWVSLMNKYDENLSTGLETEDLTIRGEYSFFKKNFKFSGLRTFNTEEGKLTTSSLFKLNFTPSPLCTTEVTHTDSGDLTSEGEYTVWQSDNKDHSVGLYKKLSVDSGFNTACTMQLIYNFGRDLFLNLGMRNMGLYGKSRSGISYSSLKSPSISVGTIYRFLDDGKNSSYGGSHLNFSKDKIEDAKFMVGVNSPNFNAIIAIIAERKVESSSLHKEKVETTIINPSANTKVIEEKTQTVRNELVSYPVSANIGFEAKLSDTFSLFSLINTSMDLQTDMTIGGIYTFDPETTLKFKMKEDLTSTFSLIRRYRNLFDFGFTANMMFKEKEKDLFSSFKTKFGLSLNFSDEI